MTMADRRADIEDVDIHGQGYHFARPLPLASAQAFLEKQKAEKQA